MAYLPASGTDAVFQLKTAIATQAAGQHVGHHGTVILVDHPHPAGITGHQHCGRIAGQGQAATADKLHAPCRIIPATVGHAIQMMNQVFQCTRLKCRQGEQGLGRESGCLASGQCHLSVFG
jgi:hypothetical protein